MCVSDTNLRVRQRQKIYILDNIYREEIIGLVVNAEHQRNEMHVHIAGEEGRFHRLTDGFKRRPILV